MRGRLATRGRLAGRGGLVVRAAPSGPAAASASPRDQGGGIDRAVEDRGWDLLLVAAAGLVLIGVARVHSFLPGAEAIRPALLVFAVGIVALMANHRGARSVRHLRGPVGHVMAFIFVWAVIGVPFSMYLGNSVRFLLEIFLRTGLVVLVIAASVRNVADLERLLKAYAIGAIAYAILAQGTGGMRDIGAGGYDPNDSAMFLASGIPLVIYFLLRARAIPTRIMFGVGLVACVSGVILSGSRGGFLALVAVMAFSLFFFRGVKPAVRAVVVALAIAVVAVQATEEFWDRIETIADEEDYNRHSPTGRVEIWKRGAGYVATSPLVGVGINNFSVAEGRHPDIAERIRQGRGIRYSAAHSVWVQIGAELGLPGLIAMLALFWVSIRLLWSADQDAVPNARGDPELAQLGEMGRPLIGLLIGLGVAGTFLSQAYTTLFWVGLGFVLAVDQLIRLQRGRMRLRPARPPSVATHGGWPR